MTNVESFCIYVSFMRFFPTLSCNRKVASKVCHRFFRLECVFNTSTRAIYNDYDVFFFFFLKEKLSPALRSKLLFEDSEGLDDDLEKFIVCFWESEESFWKFMNGFYVSDLKNEEFLTINRAYKSKTATFWACSWEKLMKNRR